MASPARPAATDVAAAHTQHSSSTATPLATIPTARLTLSTAGFIKAGDVYRADLRALIIASVGLRPYSHVDLVTVQYTAFLNPDCDGMHFVTAYERGTNPPSTSVDYLSLDAFAGEYTQAGIPLTLTFTLPPGHAFGTELKQAVLATGPPVLVYANAGCTIAAGTKMGHYRITITIDCYGRSPNVNL